MAEAGTADRSGHQAPGRVFRGKYLSITTYKRDGTAVATPVWFVQQDGRLLVETDAATGKVKRVRLNPAVRVAECTASGRLRGEQVSAVAELLPDAEAARVHQLLERKYRVEALLVKPARFVQSVLHVGRPRTTSVILAVTPQ